MFCGIDFMAIWFFFKESVLILLASILTTTFSTDFSKVLTKIKFGPENSIALNEFLEQLLVKHENLEWVDKLQTQFNDIGLSNSGLEMRKRILKRNDRRYRKRRKLRPYYTKYRNRKNLNFNLDEISHLNIDDYENALTGVLKKEGYKQQRVKQKRYIIETPVTTHKYKNHTPFDLLDLSIINPANKDKTINYQTWIGNNNFRKVFAKNKLKKKAILFDDYIERSTNCSPKPPVNIKAEELEELMKVVESTTKKKPKNHNWSKNKTLGIMNSKKTELTITKSLDRQKDDVSSQNELQTTTTPIIVIFMETSSTEKKLEKKSITKPVLNKASKAKAPKDMISKNIKIQNHLEKNILLNNPHFEQQIDANPTNANIKSINLDKLHLMTDPYLLRFTETTVPNVAQPNNLQKREKIVEEDPATVMSPEEIRRAKIEAKKLMDVDKDFNERNEPDFNKDVMQTKNNDYKEIYDYWENLKNKVNQKQKSNSVQSERKMLKSEEKREIKRNENQQNRFFSRQLLHYNYDYENLYSDYDDQENSLRRYPRDVNENYEFQNVNDDYFDYRNDQPLERRFYKRRWKKNANRNNDKGMISKSKLRNKINKLKNFFGFGHENNYNENIEDDYPVENMSIDDYTAKNNEFIDDNILNILSENPKDLKNIIDPHVLENTNNEQSFDQQNTLSQNSLSRTTFETKTDNNLISLDSNQKSEPINETSIELNTETNLKEQPILKKIPENNKNSFGQSTLPTKLTSTQSTTANRNSVQNEWHRNLEISSIIDTSFSNDFSNPYNDASKPTTSSLEKLTLYDFTTKLETTTTPLNPLSYSFTYKMNLFDPVSSSISNIFLPKEIVNFRKRMSKRELNFIKNLFRRYKTKQNSKMIPDSTTEKLDDNNLTKTPNDGKINIDKSFILKEKKNTKKLTNKYKHHHLPKYHSELKDLLKALPKVPDAQMHVDELKLNAIKKNQEHNKKTHANIKSRETTDYRADLDEEDYIPSGDFKNFDDEELEHSDLIVKHNIENSNDTKKCAHKQKHKHRPDIEEEENAMKVTGQPKIEENLNHKKNKKIYSNGDKKKPGRAKTAEEENYKNSLLAIKPTKNSKKNNDEQDIQLFYTNNRNNVLKHSCQSNTTNKTICTRSTSFPTTTKTGSAKHLPTKCPATTIKFPTKKKMTPTETCKTTGSTSCNATTCPTTCKSTTCSTSSRITTCPTTCKSTTCSTTSRITTCPTKCKTPTCPTTCKITTCPTTCKTTTCPTICKTTTCPTTCKTTTCPTTCKTTTCPTTCKTTTCPTTCKTTTCPTTCKTTTCPTMHTTTTCPTTHKRTTCPTTCKKTTCPTTCKKTTCPTTCKRTTCPTTCKTTCPTTHKRTICPTTCKTTTCKTTTCPTTTCDTNPKKCPTTCSKTKATSCKPSCAHFYSTYKFGVSTCSKTKNFLDRSKRKCIHNSQYFNNKHHKAKFNADRLPRYLIFPKRKYLYNDMPKNEYQEMKHKNLIGRLRKKYFPKQSKCFSGTNKNHLIRRKKSINLNKDLKQVVEMPVYKIYPKRIRYQRYSKRKMKSDDAEDEKQRKVLETIYHHRIQRRRNEPEYVRKSHSYDYSIENNSNLPSSYNSEVRRNIIRRTTMNDLINEDFKGITSSDSTFYSDAIKGVIPAKVVQDLYMDLNKSKNIKNIIGKALRNPRRDPANPFATIHKIPLTHQEVTNLLAMYNKLPATEKRRNKYIYNYLHTQKLFLERLMHQFKKYNHQHRNIRLQRRQNFLERNKHVVWVPNELTGFSEDSKYIKLKKRMINNNQIENFKSRIKRENYFKEVMKTRRQPESTFSKMDEWMKVKNEENKPLYLNFTF